MKRLILNVGIFLLWSNLLFAGRYYDAAVGRFLQVDPHASKYPSWSPYVYTLNNPLRFLDPDGKDVKDIQKIVNSIHNDLNKAWEQSFNTDGSVLEVRGIVVSNDGRLYAKNVGPVNASGGNLDLTMSSSENLEGSFHTHPYSKSEGGYTGVAFSGKDIKTQGSGKFGKIMIIEAGSQRFAIEITDTKLAKEFVSKNNIIKMWNDAYKNAKGTFQEKVKSAVSSIINAKNNGMKFYESIDDKKKKFQEVE